MNPREHMIMELSNDYAFVILTIVGVIGVLLYVYRGRKKDRGKAED
ncbi:hypothetical protein J2S00_001188 [Caldalkalibacillus uzonensis]|uniref:LPXTG cell wall anchor domain-containing protein n=1 Tax=Caldalkalibacillus uzonensis TaxID=353224 RepID=A0ABU0CRB0_9BACI|nr:EYxxD motif small membrane protein [Caldalkalibacillus uzonensis]MDQ0338404.1 hypothetical protein [Caldalkalibacillus uzonensis]